MFLLLIICFSLLVPVAVKLFRPHTITWMEMSAHMLVAGLLVLAGWQIGKYAETADTEVWNGQLVSKSREHGSYVRTYQCNCYQSCSGSGSSRVCTQICQTCYENRYTVTWAFDTTIGDVTVQHLDRTSRRVYRSPDPELYSRAYEGMPVSREASYTNYIRAANSSLFGQVEGSVLDRFADIIPEYPRVYNLVEIDRVVSTPGIQGDFGELDRCLDNHLREIGPNKQANIVVVLTDQGPRFRDVLAHHWQGGKKNDVIVVIGTPDGDSVEWVRTITLADNMRNAGVDVEMRAALLDIGSLSNQEQVGDAIAEVVNDHYERVPMEEFEYLKNEINPPLWAIIILTIVSIGASIGLVILFEHYDFSIRAIRDAFRGRGGRYR